MVARAQDGPWSTMEKQTTPSKAPFSFGDSAVLCANLSPAALLQSNSNNVSQVRFRQPSGEPRNMVMRPFAARLRTSSLISAS